MSVELERGEIDWSDFQKILDNVIKTNYESVIAELIDNSVDAKASKIYVEYFGNEWDHFATIVFDNGKGFGSVEKLKKSFNLAGIDDDGNRIGKYNIGMKLTPLSRCKSISVMCRFDDGKIVHRGINSDLVNENEEYGTFTEIPKHKALKYVEKVLNSKTNDWRTAVVLFDWKKKPDINHLTSADKKDFAKKQSAYFGLIYQHQLQDGKYDIFVNSEKPADKVIPKDPFWSDFTPPKIDERLKLEGSNPRAFQKDDRFLMMCFREWGTIATQRMPIPITVNLQDGSSMEEIVYVTGYVIPPTNLVPRIPKRYKKNVPVPYAPGPSYEEMGGLWFYRNGDAGLRCICFGPTRIGKDSKEGWYTLHNNPESWLNKTRIKIEFSPKLDEYLDMASTKDCVDPDDNFFDQILDALSTQISDSRLRSNLGSNKQFFKKNGSKEDTKYVFSHAQTNTSAVSKINKNCPYCKGKGPSTEMNPWHHKDTICPAKPCDVCGEECEPDNCDYECSQCGEMGEHNEENCHLNCEYCEYPEGAGGHGDEVCPKLCSGCGNPAPLSCKCDCPEGCGNIVSKCTCGGEEDDPDEEDKSFLNDSLLGVAVLRLIQGDSQNKKLIERALKHISEE